MGRPPIVLVHGFVVSGLYMAPVALRLATDFPVFAPDLPGFGLSDKPFDALDVSELAESLADWMRAVGFGSAVLIGNSLGCQIAADLASRYPDLVDRLVLASPTVDSEHRGALQQTLRWLIASTHGPLSFNGIVLRDLLAAGTSRALATFRHMLADRIEAKLPRVGVPTLVVRGSRDPIVSQRWAEEVARLLPDGRLVVIRGAGHIPNYDSPEELAQVVRAFLSESTQLMGTTRRRIAG